MTWGAGLGSPHFAANLLRWRGRCDPKVFVVPGEPALVTVFHEARPGEFVKLAGINDQLRRRPNALEGLVHLLAALQRHVEVFVSAHEERGRLDAVGMEE